MSDVETYLRVALREVAESSPAAPLGLPLVPAVEPGLRRPLTVAAAAIVTCLAVLGVGVALSDTVLKASPPTDLGGSTSKAPTIIEGTTPAQFADGCPTAREYGLTFRRGPFVDYVSGYPARVADAAFREVGSIPSGEDVRVGTASVRLRTLDDVHGAALDQPYVWVVQWPLADVPLIATHEPVPLTRTVILDKDRKLIQSYVCYQSGMNGARSVGTDVPPLSPGDSFHPNLGAEWIPSTETPTLSKDQAVAAAQHMDGGAPVGEPRAQLIRFTSWGQRHADGTWLVTNRLVWLLQWDGVSIPDFGPPVPSGQPQRSVAPGVETIPVDATTGKALGTYIGTEGTVFTG